MKKIEVAKQIEELSEHLLHQWCEGLLKLQVKGTGNARVDGGILCPACGMIHGRCIDAVYPFMRMAAEAADRNDREESQKWIQAVKEIFTWADMSVQQKKGVYWNDIGSSWTGTTVFFAISLSEALLFHGNLLTEEEQSDWKNRLSQVAEYLYFYDELMDDNINYPISNVLALYECGEVLGEYKYQEKAKRLVEVAYGQSTENGLLIGEGIPWDKKSERQCSPVDIGYNVEETIPNLILYSKISGDEKLQKLAEKYMLAHLDFMLENGAWDNSFGTRNFKWSYWGSRTSDGSALGCLLLAKQYPQCMEAAYRNLKQLESCTFEGLLYGGPHYMDAGQPPCSHHSFCHAKVLAGILDRKELWETAREESVPEISLQNGIKEYQELSIYRLFTPSVTATVTAYDWEYMRGGHVSGGTLSMLHHKRLGTLLCAGMGEYTRKEPANMQTPWRIRHECLAPRIEIVRNGIVYSSIYETEASITVCENGNDQYLVKVSGRLKNQDHQAYDVADDQYKLCYRIGENGIVIEAECPGATWICPVISSMKELIQTDLKNIVLKKEKGILQISADQEIKLPYDCERIFNLIPGFHALKLETKLKDKGITWMITWES